jgi:hypothetical protein
MRNHKAEVAELVDAADSKSAGSNVLGVQVPPSVPITKERVIDKIGSSFFFSES